MSVCVARPLVLIFLLAAVCVAYFTNWFVVQVKKKKAFEDLAQHLRTDDNKIATYQGNPITTSAGACTADNVAGGTLS